MKRRAFLRLAAAGFLAVVMDLGKIPDIAVARIALIALALSGMEIPLAVPMDVGPGDYLPPPTPEPTIVASTSPTATPAPVYPVYLPEIWGGG